MFIIGKNSKSEESGGIAECSVGYLSINTDEFDIDKYRYREFLLLFFFVHHLKNNYGGNLKY